MTQESTFTIDYESLALDVRTHAQPDISVLDIASQSGVDADQIEALLSQNAQISDEAVERLCAWIDRPIEAYRQLQEPAWMQQRRAENGAASDPLQLAELQERRRRAVEMQDAIEADD